MQQIHFPTDFTACNRARNRLVFEELLTMQLALMQLKNQTIGENGICYSKDVKMSDVINMLPFKLTKAQLRVLEEIDNDMESNNAMNRLLQGDVGSGKTVVAMCAAYKAVKSGYQATIMAPTAILATQHLENFKNILKDLNITCELLISGITKKKKSEILEKLKNGEIDILIGTHAIIEENVEFKNLGFVVTDEQHRFGVKQRTKIAEKGKNPDYWVKKIERNIQRDEEKDQQLNFMGWTVIHFWGKDILKDTEQCVRVIEETIFDQKLGEVDDEEGM